jgi:hypothetical protein
MKLFATLFAALIILPWQTPQQPPAPQAPPNCSAEPHRQFDFWIGTWDVTVAGKPAGTNRIELGHGGCVLVEHWSAPGGGTGISLNFYDRQTRQWHQTWIGSGGGALYLNGGLKDGAMVMQSAAVPRPAGGSVINRITWSRLPNGTVRQLWETSTDEGRTWSASFDGIYSRKQ